MYDVCIIGAGVVGCALARQLSQYNLNVILVDKSDDVGCGAIKAKLAAEQLAERYDNGIKTAAQT